MKFRHSSVVTSLILIFVGIAFIIVGVIAGVSGNGFKSFDTESFVEEFQSNNITSIDVDFNYGELIIIKGDSLKIDAQEVQKDSISWEINNNTLKIKTKKFRFLDFNFNFNMFGWGETPTFTLYVPDEISLENLNISTGVGEFKINDINADNIRLDCGVGDGNISNISSKTFTLDNGVGDVDINNADINDLNVDNGVGSISISGKITGNCDIDNGIGDINIITSGNISDYSFDASNGVGDISINGRSYKKYNNSSGGNHFKLDNGVGEINISIGEE